MSRSSMVCDGCGIEKRIYFFLNRRAVRSFSEQRPLCRQCQRAFLRNRAYVATRLKVDRSGVPFEMLAAMRRRSLVVQVIRNFITLGKEPN